MPDRPLSVALFSDSALPILNGVSVSIDTLVRGLRAKGHSVHLFTSDFPGYREQDPNVHRFFAAHTLLAKDYPLALPPFYPMLHEFRKHKFDVIHTHTPFTCGFVGLRWAESHEIPVVSTYHTHYDKYAHYIPLLPKRLVRYKIAKHTNYYYNNVSHVITPSAASARWLRRHSVQTPITVVPTGIRNPSKIDQVQVRKELGAEPDENILLSVGRIAVEKNFDVVVRGCAEVLASDSKARLWIVGDGPAIDRYRSMASDLGIGDRAKFWGPVQRAEVDRFYAAADAFVFGSMTETQGLVVSEAMSYGLPAVVVRGGGASEAADDGVNGFVVKNDPELFGKAVKRLLSDEATYNRLSQGAFESARSLTSERMVESVLEVYSQGAARSHQRLERVSVL